MTNLEFYKEEIKEKYKHKKHYSDNTLCREDLADTLYEIWKDNAPLTTDMFDWLCEEHIEPIIKLDKKEKEYLRAVIKPFRDKVIYIRKMDCIDFKIEKLEKIVILYKSFLPGLIEFPEFKTNAMYQEMEVCRQYTVKELGL